MLPPIFWVLTVLILAVIFGSILYTIWATAKAAPSSKMESLPDKESDPK